MSADFVAALVGGVGEIEAELDDFEIPVAEVAPEELVDEVGGFVESISGERGVHFGGDGIEAGDDPAGFERGAAWDGWRLAEQGRVDFDAGFAGALDVHEDEARGVPDLVGEGAIAFGAGFAEGDVGAGRGHGGEGEPHSIRAVLFDDLDRVDDVAFGLGHLLAVGVADQRVDVDLAEGDGFAERRPGAVGHEDVLLK